MNKPDWEAIETAYRAGVMSLREIASQHGISEGAIRKRAKRDDWSRDLNAKIQQKADDLVRKREVRRTVRNEKHFDRTRTDRGDSRGYRNGTHGAPGRHPAGSRTNQHAVR